ncbi:MAG: hypothetical protein J6B67_03635 [Oscillospiraceae bacterium]|nr:hypothetical protein [Oscillospiraceae bacterium]
MMQQYPDKKAMQEALRLANSPAGQKLLELLKNTGGSAVETAKTQAESGDFAQAKQTLSQVLASEEVKKLLREMGKSHE